MNDEQLALLEQFVTPKTVAKIANIAEVTLYKNRQKNKGIPYYKIGKLVRYKLSEVYEYLENKRIETGKR